MSLWPRTLKQKTILVVVLVALLALGNVVTLQAMLRRFDDIGATVNLAGKMRMLSQRIALEALAENLAQGGNWPEVQERYASFTESYTALRQGGTAYGLPVRPVDPLFTPTLDQLHHAWQHFQTVVNAAHATIHAQNNLSRIQVLEIMAASDDLWAHSENLVNQLVEFSGQVQQRALWASFLLFGIDIFVLLIGFFIIQSRVIRPVQEISAQCAEMIIGNYSIRNKITAGDELGQLAAVLNQAAEQIEKLLLDIATERSAVAQMQAMFNGLAENDVAGIYMISSELKLIYANDQLATMLGYSKEDLTCNFAAERMFAPKSVALVRTKILDRLEGRAHSTRYETIAIHANGTTFDVEIFGTSMMYQGQPAIIGMLIDISARKRTEDSMRRAALVYQHTSEAMVVTDPNGVVLDINPAFATITGYRADEIIGRRLNILSSGRHDRDFYKTMWDALKKSGTWSGDIYNIRKNGEEFIERLTITTSFNTDGSINSHIGLFTDVTKLRQREAVIWRQAHFDDLTQLPNRQMFQESLLSTIEFSRREQKIFALVFLDLDFFKEVNDTFGHDEGDELLRQVASRLQSCVRSTDLVARLGGDEFVLILHNTKSREDIFSICKKVLENISKPYNLTNNIVNISVSAGITFYPEDGQDGRTLLKHADLAMYAAKDKGRNQFAVFDIEMEQEAQSRRMLLRDLQKGLDKKEFLLYYQPIVAMQTGKIVKAEALIRWDQPLRGRVNPGDFIPLAEESGMIVPLGNWIFNEATEQLAAWRTQYMPDFSLSVNVSPVQLLSTDLDCKQWLEKLTQLNIPSQALVIEITERMLLESDKVSDENINTLQTAGIELALDDFGTGYSSLSYLKRFDINYIKIDRSFVCNLHRASEDVALCQAIIVMAHQLGIQVVAEGVETQEQHSILLEAGCDFGQGYWYCKPITATEMTQRLVQENLKI